MTESLEQRTNLTAEQQPVAWRWRAKGATLWVYDPTEEWRLANADKIEMQALYAAPPRPSQESAAAEDNQPRFNIVEVTDYAKAMGLPTGFPAAPDATPETDERSFKFSRAKFKELFKGDDQSFATFVAAGFAKRLERQRNALQAQVNQLMPQPCCQDYKNCPRRQCIPRLEFLLNEAIDGNAKLVDEYTSVCVHSDRQGKQILELQSKLAQAEQDAKRYQWLCSDPDNAEERRRKNALLDRMAVMSYSAASAAIDAGREGR